MPMKTYEELEHFIHKKMRMTHIYQPVMIKALLESGGKATVDEIAGAVLNQDVSQLEYYKKIVKRWPDHTLRRVHKIVTRNHDTYHLRVKGGLTKEQRRDLIEKCDLRIQEFIDKDPWIRKLRDRDKRTLIGKKRYDIIAQAKGICVACGTQAIDAALHVDHIIPISCGGSDVRSNLQVLCYKCNLEKSNRDDTDFVLWRKKMQFGRGKKRGCSLCKKPHTILAGNIMAYALKHPNSYSVIPRRHVDSFVEMIPVERQLCMTLVDEIRAMAGEKLDLHGLESTSVDHCSLILEAR